MEVDFKMYPSGEAGSIAKELHVHFEAFIHSNAVKLQSNEKEKGTSMLFQPSLQRYRKKILYLKCRKDCSIVNHNFSKILYLTSCPTCASYILEVRHYFCIFHQRNFNYLLGLCKAVISFVWVNYGSFGKPYLMGQTTKNVWGKSNNSISAKAGRTNKKVLTKRTANLGHSVFSYILLFHIVRNVGKNKC